jgi:hypothetical protein
MKQGRRRPRGRVRATPLILPLALVAGAGAVRFAARPARSSLGCSVSGLRGDPAAIWSPRAGIRDRRRRLWTLAELKEGALLEYARLRGARWPGVDLRGARLFRCDLRDADLRGADLRDAALIACDLSGAKLEGANVRGTWYTVGTRWPAGFEPFTHGALSDGVFEADIRKAEPASIAQRVGHWPPGSRKLLPRRR